jgi:hypothetical protein
MSPVPGTSSQNEEQNYGGTIYGTMGERRLRYKRTNDGEHQGRVGLLSTDLEEAATPM